MSGRQGEAGGRGVWGEFRPPRPESSVRIFSNRHRHLADANVLKVNYFAVVAAAVAAFIVSAAWYIGFGNELAKLSAVYADRQAPPAWTMLAEFGRSLIIAYLLARFALLLGVDSWKGALRLGVWIWVFPAAILVGSVLHENYPWMLASIHAGDWLIKLLVMSLIIGVWAGRNKKQK